jgi:hypothetical protein
VTDCPITFPPLPGDVERDADDPIFEALKPKGLPIYIPGEPQPSRLNGTAA